MPRPPNLTPQKIDRVCEFISAGNNAETAAVASGISKSAYYNYMAFGRQELAAVEQGTQRKPRKSKEIYVEFLERVEKAKAEAELRLVLYIAKAANEPKHWTAAAWLLERRNPAMWGRVSREAATAEETAGAVIKLLGTAASGDTGIPIQDI